MLKSVFPILADVEGVFLIISNDCVNPVQGILILFNKPLQLFYLFSILLIVAALQISPKEGGRGCWQYGHIPLLFP